MCEEFGGENTVEGTKEIEEMLNRWDLGRKTTGYKPGD